MSAQQSPSVDGQEGLHVGVESTAVEPHPHNKTSGRLRTACDFCRDSKIKCSGDGPCLNCQLSQARCTYSTSRRLGRPKGSKNKKSLGLAHEGGGGSNTNTNANTNTIQQGDRETSETGQAGAGAGAGAGADGAAPGDRHPSVDYGLASSSSSLSSLQTGGAAVSVDFDLDLDLDHMQAQFAAYDHDELLHGSGLSSASASASDPAAGLFEPLRSPDDMMTSCLSAQSLHYPSSYAAPNGGIPSATAGSFPVDPDLGGLYDGLFPDPKPAFPLPSPGPQACHCLQQQSELVGRLGRLRLFQPGGPSLDGVLHGVQLAQGPWTGLMRCGRCQRAGPDDEVLHVFAAGVQVLFLSVQRLDAALAPGRRPAAAPGGSPVDRAPGRTWAPAPSLQVDTGSGGGGGVRVSVGDFELTGDTRAEVVGVVVRRTLQRIAHALVYMWERSGRPRVSLALPGGARCAGGGGDHHGDGAGGGAGTDGAGPFAAEGRTSSASAATSAAHEGVQSVLENMQRTTQAMQEYLRGSSQIGA